MLKRSDSPEAGQEPSFEEDLADDFGHPRADWLPVAQDDALSPALLEAMEEAKAYALEHNAAATRRAYESDFKIFSAWAAAQGMSTMPAEPRVVAAFLASQAKAGKSPATIARRKAAIRYAHVLHGQVPPTQAAAVKLTAAGIRRQLRVRPDAKTPATVDILLELLSTCGDQPRDLRDRALLLIGFAGAFRRSELAAIQFEHVTFTAEGMRLLLPRSKTDQEGKGQEVAILRGMTTCPVEALKVWLSAVGITGGPLFRGIMPNGKVSEQALCDRSVALIIKRRARLCGFDDANLSGHSLRSGFLTSAADNGAELFTMMDQSRHRSVESVRSYVRRANAFKNHAGKGLL